MKGRFVDIYKIKLHETVEMTTGPITYFITRVAGGWLYDTYRLDCSSMMSTFVPYSNEFAGMYDNVRGE